MIMSEMAIHAESLTKRFGNFTAVDNISFSVEKGEERRDLRISRSQRCGQDYGHEDALRAQPPYVRESGCGWN